MFQIFKDVNVDWLGKRRYFLGLSIVLMLAGLTSAMVRQFAPGGTEAFNLGVDFKGGTMVTVEFKQPPVPTADAIRASLANVGLNDAVIQPVIGKDNQFLIKVPQMGETEAAPPPQQEGQPQAANSPEQGATIDPAAAAQSRAQVDPGRVKLAQALATFPGAEIIGTDAVGPVAGRQLRNQAIIVTLLALVGVLLYIAFRFEWTYGAAAVLTVFHDVLVTLGFFSIFQWEVSLTVIAALLTLVGFSVNDTIVTFDRVRENLRLRRRDSLYNITNEAINQTLSRTIITGGLVFLSVLAMVLFGGEVLWGFSIALFIGVIVGTYSTIAIASPLMVWWQQRV
ncbi:MAG: protein translocase subunit SecF, partial [Pyrinomonadaceae bacterium]